MLKRIALIAILALALTFAFAGAAFANFGPHGGYTNDTDACAGCHRAHTSFSEVTWTSENVFADPTLGRSALLVGSAESMSEFCDACHGDAAPGASTNVVSGVFDGGPTGPAGSTVGDLNGGVAVKYVSASSFDATLNGGGFERVKSGTGYRPASSAHNMDLGLSTQPMWGAYGTGNTLPASANLTCTSCHDPHGSSNYRLLKDTVNNQPVGGYISDNEPNPFVISAEIGYPVNDTANGGWLKHEAGSLQMDGYVPNYTQPQYRAKADASKNISGWCSGCHQAYLVRNDADVPQTYDYGTWIQASNGTNLGAKSFHRHPVNVNLSAGTGTHSDTLILGNAVVTSTVLPLEYASAGEDIASFRAGNWTTDDWMGCLTCHRAHGSSVTMTGWASASLESTNAVLDSATASWYPVMDNSGGVDPNHSSALLRADNRGVCERCHNK